MRFFNIQSEEIAKLKETVSNYQRAFASQQKALKSKKRERALVTQSLSHESSCHKAIERSLKQKRTYVRDFIEFLNTLEIPRRANSNDNTSIDTVWLERNCMKETLEQLKIKTKSLEQKLQNIRDDLQHKRLLLKELSRNFEIASESTFMSPDSESSEKENEKMMLLPKSSEQRRRVLSWKIDSEFYSCIWFLVDIAQSLLFCVLRFISINICHRKLLDCKSLSNRLISSCASCRESESTVFNCSEWAFFTIVSGSVNLSRLSLAFVIKYEPENNRRAAITTVYYANSHDVRGSHYSS